MKQRCLWTGHLKPSLVTVPIRVYNVLATGEKIAFHQLHRDCHQRIRQKLVCPVYGEIARESLVKGYEFAKDQFVVIADADLAKIRLETSGTIELITFITPEELDPVLLDEGRYYLGPDGLVAHEGFAVLATALDRMSRIGIGRVVMGGKEKQVTLKPVARSLVMYTLRLPTEVRPASQYTEQLPVVDEAQVALARPLIERRTATFDPASFTDRYQAALVDLIQAKLAGTEPVVSQRTEVGHVLNLLEALKQSVAADPAPAAPHRNGKARPAQGQNGSTFTRNGHAPVLDAVTPRGKNGKTRRPVIKLNPARAAKLQTSKAARQP